MVVYHRPVAPLAAYIEKFWYCEEYFAPHRKEGVLPSGRFQLIIHLTDAFTRQRDFAPGEKQLRGPMLVAGMRSRFDIVDTTILRSVIGVLLPGGTRPFFDESAHCFYNETVALDQLWGSTSADLRDRLPEANTAAERFRVLEVMLLARCNRPFPLHPSVWYGLNEFTRAPHIHSVMDVTKEAGLSRRRFAQLFREQVGITPKLYCRLRRFQNVLHQITSGRAVDWAEVTVAGGYYDQAHLSHEFYDFSGISPATYLARNPRSLTHVPID
jgi:AraC-like DNA-binding protein